MNRLSRLRLSGFKSIREMDLELGALNVLIGPNGAGKSNLLSFFRMMNAVVAGDLQLFVGKQGGANVMLHYGRKRTAQIHANMYFSASGGTNTYAMALAGVAPDDLMFFTEELTHQPVEDAEPWGAMLRGGHHESRLNEVISGGNAIAQAVKRDIERWHVYHFHDTSAAAPIKLGCTINDNRSLRDDGGNLAAFLYMLRGAHPGHYEQIRDTVRLAAPFFGDFVLEPDALSANMIHLAWRERASDMPFFVHQLSDGTLRFMALATALLQPELPQSPYTIVIDEPELGLHPYAITLLASMIRSASKTRQIIVATQSVTLLDALAEPEQVIVVDRKGPESTFRRLDPAALESWLEEYTLGELWEKNVLGGRP